MISKFYRPALLMVPVILLAFWGRTFQLADQSLRGDEAATVLYAALPITGLWELSRVTDPHPPFYYLMLHPWQWLLGESVWVMRFAGVLASTLSVAALYALVRRTLPGPGLSLLAALLLAGNPLQIWQAQDVRAYPFFVLFGLLSAWGLWSALTRHPPAEPGWLSVNSFRPFLPYLLFTIIACYTHYYTVFLIAFEGIFVLLNYRTLWARRWPWLTAQVIIALAILPGLYLASNFIGQAAGGIDTIPLPEVLRLAATALLTGFTLERGPGLWVAIWLTPVAVLGLIALLRRDYRSGTFWMLYGTVPLFGVIALAIDRPFFKERFLIQAQPAFLLLLAAGLISLGQAGDPSASRRRRLRRSLALLLLAGLLAANLHTLNNYFFDPVYAKAPPWRFYHDYVADRSQPGDVMLTNFPEAAVSYYSPNHLPFYVAPVERDRPVTFRLEETQKIAAGYDRIWFLPLLRQGFDEDGVVLQWLDRHADRIDQIFFPTYNLNLYLSPPRLERDMIRQPATFAQGIELRGYQIYDRQGESRLTRRPDQSYQLSLKAQDSFTLSLYWQAAGPTTQPYTVFTQLIAADGFNRTGQDNPPVWSTYPTTAWQPGERITDKYELTLPAGTPPGDHRLHLGWYQAATGQRVPVLDATGQPVADHVQLGLVVQVE
jgi:4-amino-4-deoxy-L-arabinose transferase-like glycosyltransferase